MESSSLTCSYVCAVAWMICVWALSTIIVALIQAYRRGYLKLCSLRSNRYQNYRPVRASGLGSKATPEMVKDRQKTFNYSDTLVANFYDPDRPPMLIQPVSEIVNPVIQRVAFLHGFQIDNSRNQAEHAIMLIVNDKRADEESIVGAEMRLHTRIFENYRKWCDRMGIPPRFCSSLVSAHETSYLEDIVVYLLVWGESANLRHCPESICFLYHKVMDEHLTLTAAFGNSLPHESSRYPGYFLDMVITPMYDAIAAGMKGGSDHNERKTYDDFNEFFWSPSCLSYSIHDDDSQIYGDGPSHYQSLGALSDDRSESIHVSVGLQSASKTYIEKRSWLHPIFSLRRLFEWHIVTFTLLATWAFSCELQWSYAFTLQVGSFVFLEISFLSMIWTSLEVWTVYPNAAIPLSSVYGYLIRLLAGYLVLVYQSMYYHWSFVLDAGVNGIATTSIESSEKGAHDQEPMFWWWQFAWLSLISLFFYIVESFLCWYPSVVSTILNLNDDIVQAVLNICYPFSQLYVGKSVHVSQYKVIWYIVFWLPLILFKLWFGYRYIIHPVTIPSIELYDDYMNFQKISFIKTSSLMFLWWFPHFLVYIIDLSIWYSVWSAMVGGFVALSQRQGAVRDSRSFRHHFIRSPLAFSQRILDEDSAVNQKSSGIDASTASLRHLEVHSKEASAYIPRTPSPAAATLAMNLGLGGNRSATSKKAFMSTADLSNIRFTSEAKRGPELLLHQYADPSPIARTDDGNGNGNHPAPILTTTEAMSEFLSNISNQRWILFARVWNEVVKNLRQGDHISNLERDRMLFSNFDWLSKPVYLPSFQTAGCIYGLIHKYTDASAEYSFETEPEKKIAVIEKFNASIDVTTYEAACETWELISWLLSRILGTVHGRDVECLLLKMNIMKRSSNIFGNINTEGITPIINHTLNLISLLKNSLKTRQQSLVVNQEVLKRAEEISQSKASKPDEMRSSISSSSSMNGSKMKKSVSYGFLQGLELDANTTAGGSKSSKKSDKFAKLKPFRQMSFVLVDTTRDKLREELRGLLQALKGAMIVNDQSSVGWSREDIGKLTFIQSYESGFFWSDLYASQQIDELATDRRVMGVLTKLHELFTLRQADADPSSPEARRRLNFFVNSLFMQMPAPPSIKHCREYTCMTPYYSEDVLLTRGDLESKNSDGISTLLYLQTLYNRDWINFLERKNIKDESTIWSKEYAEDTRMWASLRSQSLFRTVDGMMASEAAIRLLAEIEQVDSEETDILAKLKFNYIVACQVYGQMKRNLESKADDIDFLLRRHPNLRVAYIDSVRTNRNLDDGSSIVDTSFYSVLIKFDENDRKIKEVFRLKLPGNPVLGEGKPENQNHAIVFSRGRYLQAIDMNQEGYFEEALKMRNLLQEFEISGCTILGFREHIFTGSVSSVANYMALQELSFVSLGQRVLNNPLCIRQHYGHPDIFDKFFVMTEGGMSKASKGIHLSEDVFAGYNCTIRGHLVDFKEYVQVGKGRDVGLQQTYKFEAKLSQGNAEQSISRDIDRICDRLDFFRLLSFYYGGIGHYISNTLIMFTLVVVVYTMLTLAVYAEEGVNGRSMPPEGVFQLILAGMGVLQTFPLAVTLTVEKGFAAAFAELVYMMISGGPLYFIFHIQTKCYYFQQTLLAGGATYRATGRGFVIRHSPFDENYRFFATSHIYLGFELAVDLILLAIYTKSKQYFGLTWSLWTASIAFLLGPFWFNPVTFEWDKLSQDYWLWIRWMTETSGGAAEQSWETWWKEENFSFKRLSISWKVFLIVEKCGPWTVIAIGLFGFKFWGSTSEQMRVLQVLGLYLAYFFGNWVIAQQERRLSYALRRFTSLMLSAVVLLMTVYLFSLHLVYIRYTIAIYFFGASVAFVSLLFLGVTPVSYAYKLHDYLVGHLLFVLIGILTVLQVS
jgi:hypothetical protein